MFIHHGSRKDPRFGKKCETKIKSHIYNMLADAAEFLQYFPDDEIPERLNNTSYKLGDMIQYAKRCNVGAELISTLKMAKRNVDQLNKERIEVRREKWKWEQRRLQAYVGDSKEGESE